MTDPLLGTEVLRYRLERLIGRGGMGSVYLGVQPQIGSRVAIKVLSTECAHEPTLVERFFAEARAVNLVKHENIVSVLDLDRLPDGRPFIVMEYVEGVTLARAIRGGTAPLGAVVQVMSEVLSALAAAHAIGIVHRDLKPDNILITNKGHARVLDFGIAKLAPALRADVSPRTATGALLGTPAYMAPEQISGGTAIDGRTDVYGAGVVLFEAVTGRVPFTGASLFELMRAQLETPPPSPRSLRPELPERMEAVILTALAKQPEQRFQSATAMANALEQAAAELPAEQWRDSITRMSAPRIRPSSTAPPPRTGHERDREEPPAISAAKLPVAAARARSKRPLVLAGAGMLAAAGIGAVVAVSIMRDDPASSSAVAEAAVPAKPVDHVVPPPASPPPPVEVEVEVEQVAPAVPAKRAPRSPRTRTSQPIAAPTAPAARATSADEQRARIAEEYKMHRDHVALPGEVPIKRRPRMSRGSYNPTSFDYRAFLPHAQKLARAEVAGASLVSFEVSGVTPDGKANIAIDNRGAEFRFSAASGLDEGCAVVVAVKAKAIETYVDNPVICGESAPLPKCSFAEVWAKARAIGTTSQRANLSYARNGWVFGGRDLFHSIPDDCP